MKMKKEEKFKKKRATDMLARDKNRIEEDLPRVIRRQQREEQINSNKTREEKTADVLKEYNEYLKYEKNMRNRKG